MKRFACSLLLSAFVAAAMTAPVAAAPPVSAVDITATPAGQAAAALAAQRLTSVGHPTTAASLTVTREVDGSVSTMPKGMTRTIGTRHDGTTGPGVVLKAPTASQGFAGVSPMAGAQYWYLIGNGCLSLTKSQGWMYNCWQLQKMANAPSYGDFFLVSFNGTASSNGSGMHVAYVEVTKNTSGAGITVVDWSPKQPYDNYCAVQTVGISYIVSWSMNVTMCEHWFVYGDPIYNPGTQYSEWYCFCTVYNTTRQATVLQEVQTAKNRTPIWNLYYDFS